MTNNKHQAMRPIKGLPTHSKKDPLTKTNQIPYTDSDSHAPRLKNENPSKRTNKINQPLFRTLPFHAKKKKMCLIVKNNTTQKILTIKGTVSAQNTRYPESLSIQPTKSHSKRQTLTKNMMY